MENPVAAIEYETMVFSRHHSALVGRPRRSSGELDHSAYVLLSILRVGGPKTIGELSEITRLTVSTLTRQTATMVKERLAEHILDPDGSIARRLRITERGIEALREERLASRRIVADIVAEWSDEERRTLATMLEKFNDAIEKRSGGVWPRPTEEQLRAAGELK